MYFKIKNISKKYIIIQYRTYINHPAFEEHDESRLATSFK